MKTTTKLPMLDQISAALQTSPHVPNGRVRFEAEDGGGVVLRGHVSSFFQKQMAQETVRRIDGVESIENHLEVSWA